MDITTTDRGDPDQLDRFVAVQGDRETPSCYIYPSPQRVTELADVYLLQQIHSKQVINVPEQYSSELLGDGLVTDRRSSRLLVTVADCLPIFLHMTGTSAFGIVHSGWKGTGIVTQAIDTLIRITGMPAVRLRATIGPGIGPCCYSVREERSRLFPATCSIRRDGQTYLDLKTANSEILQAAGIGTLSIIDACTCCDERLHSYRREGPKHYGKMVAATGFF